MPSLHTRTAASAVGICFAGGAAIAQPCLSDIGGDGHPFFGNPTIRASLEDFGGPYVQDATSVAFGDLDGDGDEDAVMAVNYGTLDGTQPYLYVCFNQGDGVFQTPGDHYAAGAEPCAVELADFDGDRDLDIAAANANGDKQGTVSVLLNNGKGVFAPDVEYSVGLQPRSVKIADVNGDKVQDLTVLNVVSKDVSILIGAGNGAFAPEARYAVGAVTQRGLPYLNSPYPGPFHAAADLEGDGDIDLVIPCNSQMRLLINDGAGHFALSAAPATVAEGNAYSIAAGDMTGDGKPDLAAACVGDAGIKALSVALNKGDGTFKPPMGYDVFTKFKTTFQYTNSAALGDVDGDGDLDVAVGHEAGTAVTLMRNNGDGTLAPKEVVQAFGKPWFVRWADLNGDGRPDLGVLTSWIRSKLTAMLNDGAGGLASHEFNRPGIEEWPWIKPYKAEAADLDDDGDPDLAVAVQAPQAPGSIVVVLNENGDILRPGTPYILGSAGYSSPEFIAVADVTGDGLPDLLTGTSGQDGYQEGPGILHLIPSMGGGQFGADQTYPLDGVIPLDAAIGDVDGDEDLEVVVLASEPGFKDHPPRQRRLVVFKNTAGVLVKSAEYVFANIPLQTYGGIALGDLDGDHDLDIVAAASNFVKGGAGVLVTMKNDGRGGFRLFETEPLPQVPTAVVLADTDGDKDLDLAVTCSYVYEQDVYLIVFNNDGSGSLEVAQTDFSAEAACAFAIGADVNGDGITDLVMAHGFGAVMIRLGDGAGAFSPGVYYGAGEPPEGVAAADFDGDGRMDLVAANGTDHNFSLLRGRACRKCFADCDGSGQLDIDDFICFQTLFGLGDAKADCDGSGELDIDDYICFQTGFGFGCP